jgi:hypothetical protein
MKELPIVMSARDVCAILDGSKTQTRRAIKPKAAELISVMSGEGEASVSFRYSHHVDDDGKKHPPEWLCFLEDYPEEGVVPIGQCPYGQPSDRLWVRETWKPVPISAYRSSEGVQQTPNPQDADEAAVYKAGWVRSGGGVSWRSPTHMPRWASRITLEITDVRVERLQDISDDNCLAEGIAQVVRERLPSTQQCGEYDAIDVDPVAEYRALWETINGPGSWDANPWVWVISFKRI